MEGQHVIPGLDFFSFSSLLFTLENPVSHIAQGTDMHRPPSSEQHAKIYTTPLVQMSHTDSSKNVYGNKGKEKTLFLCSENFISSYDILSYLSVFNCFLEVKTT